MLFEWQDGLTVIRKDADDPQSIGTRKFRGSGGGVGAARGDAVRRFGDRDGRACPRAAGRHRCRHTSGACGLVGAFTGIGRASGTGCRRDRAGQLPDHLYRCSGECGRQGPGGPDGNGRVRDGAAHLPGGVPGLHAWFPGQQVTYGGWNITRRHLPEPEWLNPQALAGNNEA